MTTAPWVGRALTSTLPAKDLTSLVHWNQKHEGEPMKQYSVHIPRSARITVDAGAWRRTDELDRGVMPPRGDTIGVDDDGDGDGQAGMCIYGCTDYHLADCPTRDPGRYDYGEEANW